MSCLFLAFKKPKARDATEKMLAQTDLGVQGWAMVSPSAAMMKIAGVPRAKPKAKVTLVVETYIVLGDTIADYRESEKDFNKVKDKAKTYPESWSKVSGYIADAETVISATTSETTSLDASLKEFLTDFEVASASPSKLTPLSKQPNFIVYVNAVPKAFAVQAPLLTSKVMTLKNVKAAEDAPKGTAEGGRKRRKKSNGA